MITLMIEIVPDIMYCVYMEQILWLASNDEIKIVVSSFNSTTTKNHILPQKKSLLCVQDRLTSWNL